MSTAHLSDDEISCLFLKATGEDWVDGCDIRSLRLFADYVTPNCAANTAHDDLVKALQDALRYGGLFPDLADQARAALAKATGAQNG